MKKCTMTDRELVEATRALGYTPIQVKRWPSGNIYVAIQRVSTEELGKFSEYAAENWGVLVCQPM